MSELVIQFKYLKEFLIIFEEFLALTGGEVIPCTSTEVDILESMLPHPYRLPLAYKEFLLYGGHRMGKLTSVAELYYRVAEAELEDGYNGSIGIELKPENHLVGSNYVFMLYLAILEIEPMDLLLEISCIL